MAGLINQGDGPERMRIYSDGSMKIVQGVRSTGFGVAAYHNGQEVIAYSAALGQSMVSYDTEMEGIARTAELTRDHFMSLNVEDQLKVKRLHFYCDNTGAIYRCFAETPGKAQKCSVQFHQAQSRQCTSRHYGATNFHESFKRARRTHT